MVKHVHMHAIYMLFSEWYIVMHVYVCTYVGFATKHPSLIAHEITNDGSDMASLCRKDLGASKRLRHWSRGHLFICRPCGHIDYSQPIYRSKIY